MKAKVYSFEVCPYCSKAKSLLENKEIEFEEIVIDRSQIKELMKKTKMMTVPQIFLDDELIGGYDDLVEYFEKNKRG